MARLEQALAEAGGWLPFDRFMAIVLYEPGLGYYANAGRKFGLMPASGSDFVTAPEMSPLFGRALAVQVRQALQASGTAEVYEFGAGTGALAEQLLQALDADGGPAVRYAIVDLSGSLRERQAERLARFGDRVRWLHTLPEAMAGVVVGNEVLDAMPVQLLVRREDETGWQERGVVCDAQGRLAWADRDSPLAIPFDGPVLPGMVTEIHLQAEAFIRTLAQHLQRGVAFFIDYGFPEAEYYHPQRWRGTLMCHRLHLADDNPLEWLGEKDITAHVNFTGIALAAQDAGLEVLGYTSQARFLLNCGLPALLEAADLRGRAMAQKLITEHEMGELFKVMALATPGLDWDATGEPLGFAQGDRTHRL
ncbi:class I SAM-dependent methyltransferase [Ideonella livida]|uniref:Class I SAM-dependent methyltransferase n=1 Tax=Ideonella livida TaxID=2707176 RepID=A0A7C9TPG9_9BURK|nr:SAM-dependent methyltransferase [Ideonella livida]NDY93886.1 class I SAM-dependent methyltransferase [Ideonella livida]